MAGVLREPSQLDRGLESIQKVTILRLGTRILRNDAWGLGYMKAVSSV